MRRPRSPSTRAASDPKTCGPEDSGAATGGASVVVQPSVTSAAQLKGKSVATPSLGNTQDVAARYWLKQQGLATDTTGGVRFVRWYLSRPDPGYLAHLGGTEQQLV